MKRILFSLSLCIVVAGSVSASWMGETWLWVKVVKDFPHNGRSVYRRVTVQILKWGKGGGHSDDFGKRFPGRILTIKLKFASPVDAGSVRPGDAFWVKHHASSGFYQGEDGKVKGWSNSTWEHLGHRLWQYMPIVIQNGDKIPETAPMEYLWSIRHGDNVSLKFRYDGQGRTYAEHRIHKIREDAKSVTLAVVTVTTDRQTRYYNRSGRKTLRLLQFSAAAYKGKKIRIMMNGKQIAIPD